MTSGGPEEELDVPVAPLPGGRGGSSRAPILAACAIFAVVLGAIALARLFPADRDGSPTVAASVVPAAPSATGPRATPAPGTPAATDLPAVLRLRPEAFVAGVVDGSLDGQLVYADARLQASCGPDGGTRCQVPQLSIDGLGLDVVAGPIVRGVEDVPDQAVLVLVVRGARLEYLGSLIAARDGSPALSALPERADEAGGPVQTLYDASGWLVLHPACSTPSDGTAACLRRTPFFADDEPFVDGVLRSDRGSTVLLAPDVWGVDPDALGTEGPFLVTRGPDGGVPWQVVARYDPERSVRVVIP
jgi:hypothetical protein